jgi:dUTP pyrophosphatase
MYIKFYSLRLGVKTPEKGHPGDAGIDLFYNPEKEEVKYIDAHSTVLLKTGIKVEVPLGHVLKIQNRSSMSLKKGCIVGAGIVDPLYEGEIGVVLHNISGKSIQINPKDKIAQMILFPIVSCEPIEALDDDLYENTPTRERKDSGFGSTGR